MLQEAAESGGGPHADWLHILFAFVNFGVLLFVLIRFGGPVVKGMLQKRHDDIRKNLDEARMLREQAEARLQKYEARLANIEQEIAALIAGIKREGEAETARIVAAAEEAARRMKADAHFVMRQENRRT